MRSMLLGMALVVSGTLPAYVSADGASCLVGESVTAATVEQELPQAASPNLMLAGSAGSAGSSGGSAGSSGGSAGSSGGSAGSSGGSAGNSGSSSAGKRGPGGTARGSSNASRGAAGYQSTGEAGYPGLIGEAGTGPSGKVEGITPPQSVPILPTSPALPTMSPPGVPGTR